MTTAEQVDQAEQLFEAMRPMLAGYDPGVLCAVFTQALALWLAGHYKLGDDIMNRLLERHVDIVRRLLPIEISRLREMEEPNE